MDVRTLRPGGGKRHPPISTPGPARRPTRLPSFLCRFEVHTLQHSTTHLGPNHRVLACLDHTYILSTDDSAEEDAEIFFSSHTDVLTLNPAKCTSVSLDDVRSKGIGMLETSVGSEKTRRSFFQSKISSQTAKLDGLARRPELSPSLTRLAIPPTLPPTRPSSPATHVGTCQSGLHRSDVLGL